MKGSLGAEPQRNAGLGEEGLGIREDFGVYIPLYQPSDTKIVRVTLTQAEWWTLAERATMSGITLQDQVSKTLAEGVCHP